MCQAVYVVLLKLKSQDPITEKTGGWCNKIAALVHMNQTGELRELVKALRKLSEHKSLEAPLSRVDRKYKSEGAKAYTCFI